MTADQNYIKKNYWKKNFHDMKMKDNIHLGARGVIVIVAGNGHGDTSSNPGRDWLHFTLH